MKMARKCQELLNNNKETQISHGRDTIWEPWQGKDHGEANAAVVLRCVFALLPARELWFCGSVCRTWRHVANDDALWRRLLLPKATPHTLRVLAATTKTDDISQCQWRKEYYRFKVQWRRHSQLITSSSHSAPLLCAALHPSLPFLAVLDEDAQLNVWENTDENNFSEDLQKKSEWNLCWSGFASKSWCSATHAQWAPRTRRLLLIGCLTLTDRKELLVIEFNVEWHKTTLCRAACGPGGGCWVNDDKFLTLQLQLIAPALAFTTETQSEHTGVTTPLLRIFNEAASHVSHFITVEMPYYERTSFKGELNIGIDQINYEPTASYYRALRPKHHNNGKTTRLLIAACGAAGGARGEAQALAAWALPEELVLPQVQVREALAERVQLRRDRALLPPAPNEAPEEQAVRALCTPPAAICNLFAQIFGIVLHPRGGCLWVSTASGSICVSVSGLVPLLYIPLHSPLSAVSLPPHYLWPTVDDDYFTTDTFHLWNATLVAGFQRCRSMEKYWQETPWILFYNPAGNGSPHVNIYPVRSARYFTCLRHDAPALASLLVPPSQSFSHKTRTLLVLTSDSLNVWQALVD